jgi:glycosyltransferase involved in cell wall biosynthesis
VGSDDSPHVSSPTATAAQVLVITFGPVLSPEGGASVRARCIVEALAELGIQISVISSHEDRVDGRLPNSMNGLTVLRRPLRLGWSFELARAARTLMPQADAVIVESALLLPAVRLARPGVPVIWDTNELETLHYSRLKRTLQNRLRLFVWRQIERWAVGWTDLIIAISDIEAGWWSRLFPRSTDKLAVVRHHVPAKPVDPRDGRRTLERLCGRPLNGAVLLFVGSLTAKHNVAAADWLLDELAPQLPDSSFLVLAGPGTDRLRSHPFADERVSCVGAVADIDSVIAGADVCLAPLEAGAGVKTKILHYLAHGKVVLATPIAMEGLEGAPGVQVAPLGDFAELVRRFLRRAKHDVADGKRAESQTAWIEAEYGASRVLAQLRDALQRVGIP